MLPRAHSLSRAHTHVLARSRTRALSLFLSVSLSTHKYTALHRKSGSRCDAAGSVTTSEKSALPCVCVVHTHTHTHTHTRSTSDIVKEPGFVGWHGIGNQRQIREGQVDGERRQPQAAHRRCPHRHLHLVHAHDVSLWNPRLWCSPQHCACALCVCPRPLPPSLPPSLFPLRTLTILSPAP